MSHKAPHYDVPTTDFDVLGEQIEEAMTRLHVPGVAVGLWHQGQRYTAGYGVTNINHPLPVDGETLFQIGSITKTVTATAAMRLVEQGKLDLDATVRTYLPDFVLSDENVAAQVTVRHLFTHTGGWLGDYFVDLGMGDDALAKTVESMVDLPQLTAPGEIWHYNNAGFYVAGRIMEVITGKPYEIALRELLLEPLGMDHSFFMPGEVMIHRFTVGHIIDGEQISVAEPWGMARAVNPVGGLNSCAKDMLRYAQFHLGDGTGPDGTPLLSKANLEFMRSTLTEVGHAADAVGVSWMLKRYGDVLLVSHGGATNGQQATFVFAPDRDFALVVMTNSSRGSELHREIRDWTLDRYLGITKANPNIQAIAESALAEYVGDYQATLDRYEIRLEDGELILQERPQGGFPDKSSEPGPTPPPARIGFVAEDRIVGLDGRIKGLPGEFLRDQAGKIVWFRFGSRIHARQD